jgi:hypothetical protein
VVLSFVVTIIVKHLLHVVVHLAFLLVQVHDYIVILLLLLGMHSLNLLAGLSELSKLLDFGSQVGLDVLELLFDLSHGFSDFLQSLVLLVVKNLLLVRNTLDLIFNI